MFPSESQTNQLEQLATSSLDRLIMLIANSMYGRDQQTKITTDQVGSSHNKNEIAQDFRIMMNINVL
ncbi:hypothetical protein P255_01269 [Acinetobacter brisouii CIP 110357]|uniref:Uncharacterized protein n=1 Tax=Acinetobacter brisouii CIP 110357 TaxID=1341683 RepID=V2UT85_9GAMM|nr:hypothetical protein F954_01456 [Acinetobacter brisouii ANC 4119]ESK51840.1 hypothetical protein P255_01269 [Acinetobacter brisouii CIP 110357]